MKTVKELKTRELVSEDKGLLKVICGDVRKYKPLLSRLESSYNQLELGKLDNNVFKEIIKNGSGKIIEKYRASLESQLNNLGINSKIMRKNMIEEHDTVIQEFESASSELLSFYVETYSYETRPTLTLEHISHNEGSFKIEKDGIEAILEAHCRTYLETDLEKKAFKSLTRLNKAYGDFRDVLKDARFDQYRGFQSLHEFIDDTGDAPIVNPKALKNVFILIERTEAHNKRRMEKQA